MKLNDYREKEGLTYTELARQIGAAHASTVRRWCLPPGDENRLIPNLEYMSRIVAMTDKQVEPNDFYYD
jgi:transposase-like protein